MKINLNRVKNDIEHISAISATKGFGCTRFSYGPEDQKAREYLMGEIRKTGAGIKVDGVGNIRALIPGTDPEIGKVMVGSHIDTVKNGGKFDGLLGVIGGLEILRVIQEDGIKLNRGIELIVFAEEEGSNFGSTMMGSKSLVGFYQKKDLLKLKNDQQVTAYQALKDFGLDPDNLETEILAEGEVEAMLELHIEQGQVLDEEKLPIGIVDGIFGMKNIRITLQGQGNHAGATPMIYRKDPVVTAGRIFARIQQIALEDPSDTVVATVGKIQISPNMSNVIADQVVFYVDIRDIHPEGMESVLSKIKEALVHETTDGKSTFLVEEIAFSSPVQLEAEIIRSMESLANLENIPYKRMHSGAVHDCAMLASHVKAGMIFVPSIGGRSHVPEEDTDYSDIETGLDLLLKTAIHLARK